MSDAVSALADRDASAGRNDRLEQSDDKDAVHSAHYRRREEPSLFVRALRRVHQELEFQNSQEVDSSLVDYSAKRLAVRHTANMLAFSRGRSRETRRRGAYSRLGRAQSGSADTKSSDLSAGSD